MLFLLFLATVPFKIYPQSYGGGYSEAYLLRDVGARPIAMSGAYTAVVNEPSAIFYNPAGLGFLVDTPMVMTSYSFLEFGRTHSALAWGQSILKNLGVGVGINSFTSGSFEGRDIMGNPLGTMTDWSYSIVGGASYRIEYASMGIAAKYLTNNLTGSDIQANGYSVDMGMKFNIVDLFSFGVAMQNVSGKMFWNTKNEDRENIPYTIRSGVAMEFGLNNEEYTTRTNITGEREQVVVPATRYVLVSMDFMMTQYEIAPKLVLGAEAIIHEMFGLRGGIALYGEKLGKPQPLPMNIWGGGVTIRPELEGLPFQTHIDYSISSDYISTSGISHNLSLMLYFD